MCYRIALVDDQKEIIKQLTEELNSFGLVEIVFTAHNGTQYLNQMKALPKHRRPQVVLMDIDMPVMGGIEAVRRGSELYHDTQYIMFTVSSDDVKLFEALRAGAGGYLLKDEEISSVLSGIKETIEKEGAPMSPSIARKVLKLLVKDAAKEKPVADELSEKEIEVLKNMVSGLNYRQIADKMVLSPFTIRNHITKIYTKLHVNSKAQAVRLAVLNKW